MHAATTIRATSPRAAAWSVFSVSWRGVELRVEQRGRSGTNEQAMIRSGGSSFFNPLLPLEAQSLPSFLDPPTFRQSLSVSSIPLLVPHQLPDTTNMNLPMTRTNSITINQMMVPISIFLAIGAGFFQNLVAVEASNTKTVNNFADNNFAFGRPISPTRRKRLPGSQLKGGRGLLTIEELEEEFEAVRLVAHTRPKFIFLCFGSTLTKSIVPFLSLIDISFGDLFFDRVLQESSMSYSMSYEFG